MDNLIVISAEQCPKYTSEHFGFSQIFQQSHGRVSLCFTPCQVNHFVLSWLPSEPVHPFSLLLGWNRGTAILDLDPGHLFW